MEEGNLLIKKQDCTAYRRGVSVDWVSDAWDKAIIEYALARCPDSV